MSSALVNMPGAFLRQVFIFFAPWRLSVKALYFYNKVTLFMPDFQLKRNEKINFRVYISSRAFDGTLVLSLESPTIKRLVKMTSKNQILNLAISRYSVI